MSTRIVCTNERRRPASPFREVPTARVPTKDTAATTTTTATTTAVETPDGTTNEEVKPIPVFDLSGRLLPAPIPIPSSAHPNPRVAFFKIESYLAKRSREREALMGLNSANSALTAAAALRATTATNSAANNNTTTPTNSAANNNTTTPTNLLLSPIRPAWPAICPLAATAPTTHNAPAAGPKRTKTRNGRVPIVYGGGRATVWVLAPVEPAKKPDPMPAQLYLAHVAAAHDAAVPGFLAERKRAERVVDRSEVVSEKFDAWGEEESGDGDGLNCASSRELELEGEEARCSCSGEECLAGVKCGRGCVAM